MGIKVLEGIFTGADSFTRRFPANDVSLVRGNNLSPADKLGGFLNEDVGDKFMVPGMRIRILEVINTLG